MIFSSVNCFSKELLNKPVIIINNKIITLLDFEKEVSFIKNILSLQGSQYVDDSRIKKRASENLITENLIQYIAEKNSIFVNLQEIDSAISRLIKNNKTDLESYKSLLADKGIIWSYYLSKIKHEIRLQKIKEIEVGKRVSVSEKEIMVLVDEWKKDINKSNTEIKLGHILVTYSQETQKKAERFKIIQNAFDDLNNNVSFNEVSIKYSEADNALDGGVTDWINIEQLPSFFYEEVKNLEVGQISEIIESPNGFHIIQIYNSRNLNQENGKKYRVSHIILKENDVLASEDIVNKMKEIKKSISNNLITFEDAAKKYSEDASSIKGGDLGWLSAKEIITELKSIIINQVPGELSEPVKSSFGWHLISVRDVTSGQVQLNKDLFERAKRLLTLKKIDEAYVDWIDYTKSRSQIKILDFEIY
jgi:peptidyl-prolyl cis-trans isomerase SurA